MSDSFRAMRDVIIRTEEFAAALHFHIFNIEQRAT
jgi:hypothetical protein